MDDLTCDVCKSTFAEMCGLRTHQQIGNVKVPEGINVYVKNEDGEVYRRPIQKEDYYYKEQQFALLQAESSHGSIEGEAVDNSQLGEEIEEPKTQKKRYTTIGLKRVLLS